MHFLKRETLPQLVEKRVGTIESWRLRNMIAFEFAKFFESLFVQKGPGLIYLVILKP